MFGLATKKHYERKFPQTKTPLRHTSSTQRMRGLAVVTIRLVVNYSNSTGVVSWLRYGSISGASCKMLNLIDMLPVATLSLCLSLFSTIGSGLADSVVSKQVVLGVSVSKVPAVISGVSLLDCREMYHYHLVIPAYGANTSSI